VDLYGRHERSGRPVQGNDGRDDVEISKGEMRDLVKITGVPWHRSRKKISLKRVNALREAVFSLRQVAKIYKTSEATIRRRLEGK
jgi:hypothetical protein